MSNYLPFGFRYPDGFPYSDANPDPGIESIRKRIDFLNTCHDLAHLPDGTSMPGHIYSAALDLFQSARSCDIDAFWDAFVGDSLTPPKYMEVARIAEALAPQVMDAKPYLDFPNTIPLFDCRFVSTKEWEHIRRYSIGGSEVAAILGLSHYQSARGLYYEKKAPNLAPHDMSSQQIFDYGHILEDYIVGHIASLLGATVYPEPRMFAHKKYPFLTCNPDGILAFPDGSFCLFEAKTATRWKLDDWRYDIPDYYVPQPRHYLEVMDDPKLNSGFIGCCLGALYSDIRCHHYDRDRAAGQAQIEACVAYWKNHIVPGVLPDFCGVPELDLNAAYGYGNHNVLCGSGMLAPDAESLFKEYFALEEQVKLLKGELLTAKISEQSLLDDIEPQLAEGITLCSAPGNVTYKIKVTLTSRESVQEDHLPPDLRKWLQQRAEAVREKTAGFNVPKIKKSVVKAKR